MAAGTGCEGCEEGGAFANNDAMVRTVEAQAMVSSPATVTLPLC